MVRFILFILVKFACQAWKLLHLQKVLNTQNMGTWEILLQISQIFTPGTDIGIVLHSIMILTFIFWGHS